MSCFGLNGFESGKQGSILRIAGRNIFVTFVRHIGAILSFNNTKDIEIRGS